MQHHFTEQKKKVKNPPANAHFENHKLRWHLNKAGKIYSIDSAREHETVLYPTELFNTLEPSGTPSHRLPLKVGASLIHGRSLDPPQLCNGTMGVVT